MAGRRKKAPQSKRKTAPSVKKKRYKVVSPRSIKPIVTKGGFAGWRTADVPVDKRTIVTRPTDRKKKK